MIELEQSERQHSLTDDQGSASFAGPSSHDRLFNSLQGIAMLCFLWAAFATLLIAIIAISEDKDIPGILDALEPLASHLVVTSNSSPRSADPQKLAEMASEVFGPDRVTAVDRLDDAIEAGVTLADEADATAAGDGAGPGGAVVLIAGSVVTAGEARLLLTRGRAGEPALGPADARGGEPGTG